MYITNKILTALRDVSEAKPNIVKTTLCNVSD